MNESTTKRVPYRGLLVFLAIILAQISQAGMLGNLQSLLLEPVSTSLNISRTLYSSLDALTQTVNLIVSLFMAALTFKIGIQNVFRIGIVSPILYCFCMYAAGTIENLSLPMLSLLIGIGQGSLGVASCFAATIPLATLINNWFAKRRGTMVTVATAFSSLSSTVFSPIVAGWIRNYGWQTSLLWRGFIMIAAAVLVCVLVKEKPGPNDVRIWEGQTDDDKDAAKKRDTSEIGLTLGEALRTPRYYLLILFFFLAGGGVYAANNVLPAYATDLGHVELTGTLASIGMFTSMIVALMFGGLLERFGGRRAFTPIIFIPVVGLLLLSKKNVGTTDLIIGAVCIRIAFVIFMGPTANLTRDMFGDKDFARVSSYPFAGFVAGFIVMYPLANVGYEYFGSYRQVFLLVAVLYVICWLIMLYIGQDKFRAFHGKQQPVQEAAE